MKYLAFVQRDPTGAYYATLPDFPGCSATATSWLRIEQAIRNSVRVHVDRHQIDVPPPTPIELLTEDSAPPNSCWMLAELFVHEVRPSPGATPRAMPRARPRRAARAKRSPAAPAPVEAPRVEHAAQASA
jgi:predicted RNase H-like HicB family nuclease